jgi:hypothetical protein
MHLNNIKYPSTINNPSNWVHQNIHNWTARWRRRNWCRNIFLSKPTGGTLQKLSSDTIFVVCSHTFTLIWLRKMAVTVKIFQLSFCAFACALPTVISSILGKSFPFPFPYFELFVLQYFPFFVIWTYTTIAWKHYHHVWQPFKSYQQ